MLARVCADLMANSRIQLRNVTAYKSPNLERPYLLREGFVLPETNINCPFFYAHNNSFSFCDESFSFERTASVLREDFLSQPT